MCMPWMSLSGVDLHTYCTRGKWPIFIDEDGNCIHAVCLPFGTNMDKLRCNTSALIWSYSVYGLKWCWYGPIQTWTTRGWHKYSSHLHLQTWVFFLVVGAAEKSAVSWLPRWPKHIMWLRSSSFQAQILATWDWWSSKQLQIAIRLAMLSARVWMIMC